MLNGEKGEKAKGSEAKDQKNEAKKQEKKSMANVDLKRHNVLQKIGRRKFLPNCSLLRCHRNVGKNGRAKRKF